MPREPEPAGADPAEALARAAFRIILGRAPTPERQAALARRFRQGGLDAVRQLLEELAARAEAAADPLGARPALVSRGEALAAGRDARLTEVDAALATLAAERWLRPDQREYGQTHRHRFAEAAQAIALLLADSPDWPACPVLEIGSSITPMLFRRLFPALRLHSLDLFDHPKLAGVVERHFQLDLEKVDLRAAAALPARGMALILLDEVLEHLLVNPANLFRALRDCLRPGGFLHVSTPNYLHRPVEQALSRGRNPAPVLPAGLAPKERFHHHVREYTMAELLAAMTEAGLEPVAARYSDANADPASWAGLARPRWPVLNLVGRRPGTDLPAGQLPA